MPLAGRHGVERRNDPTITADSRQLLTGPLTEPAHPNESDSKGLTSLQVTAEPLWTLPNGGG